MRWLTFRAAILVACEALLIVVAVAIAAFIRLGEWAPDILFEGAGFWRTLLVVVVVQGCLYYADLYNLSLVADRREAFVRLVQAIAAASLILAGIYYWFPEAIIGRGVFLMATMLILVGVSGWRLSWEWLARKVGPRERLLLVGTNPVALSLAREMFERRHELGVEIIGFVDPDVSKVGDASINPAVIGTIEDIPSIVRARGVDRVVVSLIDARGKLPMEKMLEMKLDGVTFDHLPSVYEEYTGKIAVENLRPSWLVFSQGFRKSRTLTTVKRTMDIVLSGGGLILGAPLFALVALAVKWTSPGPILYHQRRVGLRGHVFWIHKFRSMRQDAEARTGAVWASPSGDSRVTPIGRFLRTTRLDELPQLWNIFKGEMSFVGPRPERPEFVTDLTKVIPYYGQRHIVRPGLTGWAQVCYTYGASTEDALQKLQFDLYYIKNLSIGLDLYIMFETIKTVVLRKGA
jgi:sugar transferase (PEP-CTERM system associated)